MTVDYCWSSVFFYILNWLTLVNLIHFHVNQAILPLLTKHKLTVPILSFQITSARNKSRAAITAALKVIFDHFVYFTKAGCWSSNS